MTHAISSIVILVVGTFVLCEAHRAQATGATLVTLATLILLVLVCIAVDKLTQR